MRVASCHGVSDDALGHARSGLDDVPLDRGGDGERVLVADAEDLDHHRRLAVEERGLVRVGEAVDDPGHVAEADPRAVAAA